MLGNWSAVDEIGLDGDGLPNTSGNYDTPRETEVREQNLANQITEQTPAEGTFGPSPPELPFAYDAAGNLKTQSKGDGTWEHRYTHDAWNRLVKVERVQISTQATVTIQSSRYNALHWRVVSDALIHDPDKSPPTGPNQRRVMWYDASWRLIQEDVFEAPYTTSPPAWQALPASTEACGTSWLDRQCQTIFGLRGIDDLVARRVFDRPENEPNWTGITTPTENARGGGAHFYLTDPQGSPLAIIDAGGFVSERLSYSAYGVPQHHWPEDLDNNGQVDPDDQTEMINWFFGPGSSSDKSIGGSVYNVDYDISLYGSYPSDMWGDFATQFYLPRPSIADGDLAALHGRGGAVGGREMADNIFGWCGYVFNQSTGQYLVRYRDYDPQTGRWLQRDPAGFVDSMNLYGYGWGNPVGVVDPMGLEGNRWYNPLSWDWGATPTNLAANGSQVPGGANLGAAVARAADAADRGDYMGQSEALERRGQGVGNEVLKGPANALKASFTGYIVVAGLAGGISGIEDIAIAGAVRAALVGAKAIKRLADGTWIRVAENGAEAVIDDAKAVKGLEQMRKEGKLGDGVEGGCDAKKAAQGGSTADNGTTAATKGGAQSPSRIDRAAFKAEREAYWKAEAKNNPGQYSSENLARMEEGRAPIGSDGHPMELHHADRTPEGELRPMTRTEHRLGPNYKRNHP